MTASAVLALLSALTTTPDTTLAARSDSIVGPVRAVLVAAMRAPEDTVRPRRRSVEVGEWYNRRLTIHRYGSYAMYPLFALQAIAGNQVYNEGKSAPEWARVGHRVGATGLATVFTLNTVTGLWNLWESREVEQDRTRRTIHTLLMLASDAGFTYAGVRLSEDAERDSDKRELHRTVAYSSMATALAGVSVMVLWKED